MVFSHVYSVYTLPNTCRPTRAPPVKVRQWPSRLAQVINVQHQETIQRVLYRPTYYASNTTDGRRREMATGGLCAILLHSTGDYRPNDRTCWYNKTYSNTNSNFTNEVRVLEKKNEFNIPSSVVANHRGGSGNSVTVTTLVPIIPHTHLTHQICNLNPDINLSNTNTVLCRRQGC